MNWIAIGVLFAGLSSGEVLSGAVWPQFRGPNSAGVAEGSAPTEFGPSTNLAWRAELPPGKSSPVFTADRIFLTGHDGDKLLTLCLDRKSGKEVWRRDVPRARQERRHKLNDAAAATPVTDGRRVVSFFPDFGLVAYAVDGKEQWRMPLDPMPSMQGVAGSPILHGGKLFLVVDQAEGSYMMAVNAANGETVWKQDRRPAPGGAYSSPVVFRNRGEDQIVTFSPFELAGFAAGTGEKRWWVSGLPPQPKSTPLVANGVIYCYARSFFGDAVPPIPAWDAAIGANDKNGDGKLQKEEAPEGPAKQFFGVVDRNKDGVVDQKEWLGMAEVAAPKSAVVAIKPEGRGDLTGKAVLWRFEKNIPDVPSPLLYQGALYMVQNGGILSTLDPMTGAVRKQGRITGALGDYYSSPVAAGGIVYTANQSGQVASIRAGAEWDVVSVNNLEEECFATPAILDGAIYVRTAKSLWAFRR